MKKNLGALMKAYLHCVTTLVFFVCVCMNANAQTIPGTNALELKTEVAVDSRGIDLISGDAMITGVNLSLGDSASGISYTDNSWNGRRTQFSGAITQMQSNTDHGGEGCQGLSTGLYFSVNTGKETVVFKSLITTNIQSLTTDQLIPVINQRGSLVFQDGFFTYTDQDGAQYKFASSSMTLSSVASLDTGCLAGVGGSPLVKILKPDGEGINIDFGVCTYWADLGRKICSGSSVTSSLGWMIKEQTIEASGDRKTVAGSKYTTNYIAVNTSEEYCGLGLSDCSNLTKHWQQSTQTENYSRVGSESSYFTSTVKYTGTLTDMLGKETTVSYNYSTPSTDKYDVTVFTPSQVKRIYTRSLCTTGAGQGCDQDNPYRNNVYSLQIGSSVFSYNYGYVEGSHNFLKKNKGPDSEFTLRSNNSSFPYLVTDNLNRTTKYTYSSKWKLENKIDNDSTGPGGLYSADPALNGGFTHADYDTRGNMTSIKVYPKNISSSPLIISAIYPDDCTNPKTCNKPTSVTDQNGVTTTYEYYSEHGGLKSVTKPAIDGVQAQTLYKYEQKIPRVKNSSGSLVDNSPVWRLVSISKCMTKTLNTCAGTADELRTEYSDFNNNLQAKTTTIKHGDGSVLLTTTRDYDIYGNLSWEDGPRPGSYDTTYYYYDDLRQKIGEIGPDPDGSGPLPRQATSIEYNGDGKVTKVKKGTVTSASLASILAMTVTEQTETEYSSAHGLPIFETYTAGSIKKIIQKNYYDSDLRLKCVAQRLSLSKGLDACSPGTGTETYSDNSTATVNDRITQYAYDETGALLSTTLAFGTTTPIVERTNTYSAANGLLESEADGAGNKTIYEYDDFKRPEKTFYPKASDGSKNTDDFTKKTYSGNFVSKVQLRNGHEIIFTPDALGRVKTKSGALSECFTYDNFNQVVSHSNSTTCGSGTASIYDRQAIGWLNSETRTVGGVSQGAISYGYDAYGHRTSLTWPDAFTVKYVYDVSGYAGDYLQKITDSADVSLAAFDYYDTGKRKSLKRGNDVITSYVYDDMQRLQTYATDVGGTATTHDISESFSYTLAGQLKSRSMTTNNTDYIYASTAASSVSYTPNALNQIASAAGKTFGYDKNGNLTSTDTLGTDNYVYNDNNLLTSATLGGVTTTLTYDAENRLGSVTKSSATTKFIYDGTDLIAETDASNTILRRYVHGPENDDPILWYEGSGSTDKRYYTTDRQGSVVGLTLQSGTQAVTAAYDEYGIQKNSNIGRFQYTGQTWLPEVGLYYYKARMYSPTLGRFLQTDPIGYKDGMSWYAYVGNDPLNRTDPTGTEGVLDDMKAGAASEQHFYNTGEVKDAPHNAAGYAGVVINAAARSTTLGLTVGTFRVPIKVNTNIVIAKTVNVSQAKYGEAATHIEQAQQAGHPSVLTIDRGGADANRAAAIGGLDKVPGKQLDEYPPAMFKEGGEGASVQAINPRDNMAAGACIGNACRGLADGEKVKIKVVP